MRNGGVFQRRRATIWLRARLAALADGIGHFAGFAKADADAALLVAHDHQRAEIESATAFDHFGGAVDEDDLLGQFLGSPGLSNAESPAASATDLLPARRTGRARRGSGTRCVAVNDFGFCHSVLFR